ncbi:hypothetical protein B0T21DRAFT_375068 [Apiosordaria backusii]|uniref:rRNA adenine N(6)-methyltransferase n=1 Tax=Apiosordaria backusii TaxID=314023 RepID=A0AA40AIK7_9PEZI|nr:hypothetical protein B0T21DRAFT_375068 [Apiosordaria backusii]
MLPVRYVAQATILRSLSSRRLINNITIHRRALLRSSCLYQHQPHRHYARLAEDAAAESAPKSDALPPGRKRSNAGGDFLCPFGDCDRAVKGFSRKANLERHIERVHGKAEGDDTIEEILNTIKEIPPKPRTRRKRVVDTEAKPAPETPAEEDVAEEDVAKEDVALELAPQTEPIENETPPTATTLGSLLDSLETTKPPKPRTRRKRVVETESQPEPQPPADNNVAPEPTPQPSPANEETPPTPTTLANLLAALETKPPKRPRGRPKRVTDAEAAQPEADPTQESQTPTEEQEQPPPHRKPGRPPGSKSKNKPKLTDPSDPSSEPKPHRTGRPPRTPPGYTADCLNPTHLRDALWDTGVWGSRRGGPSQGSAVEKRREARKKADPMRVNIVSEKLCDDVLEYMKPGLLERHKGCDILDINPGAGLWSRKLNDMLQPRRHVLVEEDDEVYEPLLKPLAERQGVKIVPAPGIIWKELFDALGEEGVLPEQTIKNYEVEETPESNDTLLVVMNLLTRSKKKMSSTNYGNMSGLVLHQLIASVRTQALFQRYGLVRMLVWLPDEEKIRVLPKTIQRRRVGAIQAELSADWLVEVAGMDHQKEEKQYTYKRDSHIDLEGMGAVLGRMKEAGYKVPEGRETELMQTYLELEKEGSLTAAGEQDPLIWKRYETGQEQLEALKEEKLKEGTWTREDQLQLTRNKWLNNQRKKQSGVLGEMLAKLDRLMELKVQMLKVEETGKEPEPRVTKQFESLEAELKQTWQAMDQPSRSRFLVARDNLRAFKQPPELGPLLMWDRRHIEPLAINADEFFPPVSGCLLDIQPRAMEPILRAKCPHGSRVFDQLDLIIRHLYLAGSDPIGPALDGVCHGAREGVGEQAKSFHDIALGGSPIKGEIGEIDMRTLSRTQIVDLIQRWQEWPFKPTFPELVGRLAETEDEESETGATGTGMFGPLSD